MVINQTIKFMIQEQGKYYLYQHVRVDKNEIFYIGIGTKYNNEKRYKRAHDKRNRNIFWKRITAKTEWKVEILLESDNHDFILQKEVEFIKFYGRKNLGKGTLANLTDGGEGNTGVVVSEERRKQMSQWAKQMVKSPKFLEMLSKMDYSHLKKKVYQYNLDGNFVKEWSSLTDAAKELNISIRIVSACASDNKNSKKKRVADSYWRYYKVDKLPDEYMKMPKWTEERRSKFLETFRRRSKKIKMTTLNGTEIMFDSLIDIVTATGFDRSSVLKCCKGKMKTHKQNKFEFVNG